MHAIESFSVFICVTHLEHHPRISNTQPPPHFPVPDPPLILTLLLLQARKYKVKDVTTRYSS